MKKYLLTACLYTIVTTILLGLIYPVALTMLARTVFRNKADGQMIIHNNRVIGSAIIGQPFSGTGYFHSRPSAAGTGYDASASSGSNLGPTNQLLVTRVESSVRAEAAQQAIPIDLVTASGSGLDPDITPAAAFYQVPRIAQERHLPEDVVRQLVIDKIKPRQFGLLGEPTVNVLLLNLALDGLHTPRP
jgi:K+-transporting ATPase ATPase C chain